MSRSASDATRFTATGPHAYSKPPASSSPVSKWPGLRAGAPQQQPSSDGGRQETPKEKVERLRAEARATRIKNSSSYSDRIVMKGRTWADRAHRATVVTLIAASGIAGILTIYSASSLMMHNRRQRALWIDKEMERLMEAKKAYVAGTATPEQIATLEKEKAADEEKWIKNEIKKQGYIYKTRQWLFGGLKQDEAVATETEAGSSGDLKAASPGVLDAVNAKRADNSTVPENAPSQKESLNEKGESGTQDGPGSKSSWMSWVTGR